MMNGYGSMMGWGWMWIFWILIVIGVVLLVVLAVRMMRGDTPRRGGDHDTFDRARPQATARQTLEQRYARGEIDTEEYRERLRVLEEDH